MGVACMGGADCGGCADGAAEGEARGKKSKAGKKGAKKDKIAEAAVAPSAECKITCDCLYTLPLCCVSADLDGAGPTCSQPAQPVLCS